MKFQQIQLRRCTLKIRATPSPWGLVGVFSNVKAMYDNYLALEASRKSAVLANLKKSVSVGSRAETADNSKQNNFYQIIKGFTKSEGLRSPSEAIRQVPLGRDDSEGSDYVCVTDEESVLIDSGDLVLMRLPSSDGCGYDDVLVPRDQTCQVERANGFCDR